MDTVLHLVGGAKGDDVVAAHLAATPRDVGPRHLVHISVIGADRMPTAWFAMAARGDNPFTPG
ncbi:hypothetical protein [Streptomyces sp. NPDC016845]|uniref:hypothetical protein n=1 Tax=Streptomyces sp. NPDC016845 TaxID=3364972 RepID=UPI0037B8800C